MTSLLSVIMFSLALFLFATTSTLARSSVGHTDKFDKPRYRKGNKSEVKKPYDVYDILDDGLLLIQGLMYRSESLSTQKEEGSWPGQKLDWSGDIRTQVEMNMMGI